MTPARNRSQDCSGIRGSGSASNGLFRLLPFEVRPPVLHDDPIRAAFVQRITAQAGIRFYGIATGVASPILYAAKIDYLAKDRPSWKGYLRLPK